MPTLKFCESWDHGTLAKKDGAIAAREFYSTTSGTPTVTTSTPRTGTYCLEISSSAGVEYLGWDGDVFGTGLNVLVMGFAVRFPSALPTSDVIMWTDENSSATYDVCLGFRNSDDKLIIKHHDGSGTPIAGPVVVADTWYWIDIRLDTSGTTWTCDWAVDGVAQTQWTGGNGASATHGVTYFSTFQSQTVTFRIDDVLCSTTSGDYPLGPHKVIMLKPDTGGTTAEIGTVNGTSRFQTNSAADATHNSANILAAISEVPPTIGGTASGLCQRASGATIACGVPMTTYTLGGGETVSGMRIKLPGWAATTTAASLGIRTYNGTTETTLQAAADLGFDADTANPSWWCMMATTADFDTQAEVDAFVMRIGYSTDVSPVPGVHAIYADLAVKEATVTATPPILLMPARS